MVEVEVAKVVGHAEVGDDILHHGSRQERRSATMEEEYRVERKEEKGLTRLEREDVLP